VSSKDWIDKDFYATLGVGKSATPDEIKKSYRKLARELHPDRNPGNGEAEERFKAVSEANDVLADPRKRSEYDEMRQLFGSSAFRRNTTRGGGAPGGQQFGDLFGDPAAQADNDRRFGGAGFSDLFGSIFSGGAGGRTTTQRRPGQTRGRDVEAEVALNFGDAVRGVTMPITLRAPGVCDTCHGAGTKPGAVPHTCPVCHGSGLVTNNQGAFSLSEPCRNCQGVGTIIDEKDRCPECHGTGGVTKTRTLTIRIPAGVADGQKIRLAGRGEPGDRGGPAGDLYVLIQVREDPLFGRDGDDLTLAVPISFPEAVNGVDLRVPTLDGSVTLRVPPGTPSGRTLRVRGKGVAPRDKAIGDLLVTVFIAVPKELSMEARKALDEFAAATPPAPRDHIEGRMDRV
jgi:molecular chaperone DnaJ